MSLPNLEIVNVSLGRGNVRITGQCRDLGATSIVGHQIRSVLRSVFARPPSSARGPPPVPGRRASPWQAHRDKFLNAYVRTSCLSTIRHRGTCIAARAPSCGSGLKRCAASTTVRLRSNAEAGDESCFRNYRARATAQEELSDSVGRCRSWVDAQVLSPGQGSGSGSAGTRGMTGRHSMVIRSCSLGPGLRARRPRGVHRVSRAAIRNLVGNKVLPISSQVGRPCRAMATSADLRSRYTHSVAR